MLLYEEFPVCVMSPSTEHTKPSASQTWTAIWKDAFQVTILSELSAILADMLSLALLRS